MRKFLSVVFCATFLFTLLCGYAYSDTSTESGNRISVISTIFAPYDFVREISAGHVDLTMLLPPGTESHSYEPSPRDIIRIQNCNVFVYVGGESDAWVDKILDSMDTSDMTIVKLMDCVEVVEEEIVDGMQAEHEADEDHEDEDDEDEEHEVELDEHVWTSPKNAALIVQKLSEILCVADAENAAIYKENTEAYLAKLQELDEAFQAIVNAASRKTLVFGDRFPFRYFADSYGLDYFAAFPGCSTETEPSAATIAFLIDKVRNESIPVVFHAELSNQKMANTISEATGANVLLLHACHNVTRDEMANGVSYLALMQQNAANLKEALS